MNIIPTGQLKHMQAYLKLIFFYVTFLFLKKNPHKAGFKKK